MSRLAEIITSSDPGIRDRSLDELEQAALERDIVELLERLNRAGAHSLVLPSEYLEVVIVKR